MVVRAAAAAVAGLTGLYVLAWRCALAVEEPDVAVAGPLVVRLAG